MTVNLKNERCENSPSAVGTESFIFSMFINVVILNQEEYLLGSISEQEISD